MLEIHRKQFSLPNKWEIQGVASPSTNATMEDVAPAEHVNVVDVVDTVESTDTVTDSGVVTDAGETRHSPVIVSQVLFTFFLVTTMISCA